MSLDTVVFETEMGPLVVRSNDDGLVSARFDEQARTTRDAFEVAHILRRYFDGDLEAPDRLPLSPQGTAFQHRVWQQLRAVRPGTTATYGELAEKLGSVARAVGNANARNPIALVVPCHRVIGKDGSMTGYAYGTNKKRWLLQHEGVRTGGPASR